LVILAAVLGSLAGQRNPDPFLRRPSTFFTDESGARALLLVMKRLLPSAEQWRRPLNSLALPSDQSAPGTLIVAGPEKPITQTEAEHLDRWLADGHWDVIHFNWGLRDLSVLEDGANTVPLDRYERNLRLLVERLGASGPALVWATTTPVPPDHPSWRRPDDAPDYAAAAARVMGRLGVPVDDLGAFVTARPEIRLPADVHFTPESDVVLAEPVARSILEALKLGRADRER